MAPPATPVMAASDGPPEADRLEGFAHPRESFEFHGNAAAEAHLLEAYKSNRLHHAWLLAGPEGVGKSVLAYRFTRFLLAGEAERMTHETAGLGIFSNSLTARQVARLAHPNLLVLRRPWLTQTKRFAASIPVDEVRRLRDFLGLTAAGGNWRIVIVDTADELNHNAANALLKALEEPPKKCVFLLISAMPGRLLATIRSRCQRLELQPLTRDDLHAAVLAACRAANIDFPSDEDFVRLDMLSGGSVRRALELMSGDGLDLYRQLIAILQTLPRADYAQIHSLAERISPPNAASEWQMFQSLLDEMLHRLVKSAATGVPHDNQEADLVRRLAIANHLAEWACLWETVTKTRAEALALNLDRKNLILEIFQKLETAASLSATR